MPRVVITAVKCEPYSMQDEKTGKTIQGTSGRIWGIRCKPQGTKGVVGCETFSMNCEGGVAELLKQQLMKAGIPLVVNCDFDLKGTGAYMKQNCTDGEVLAALDPRSWAMTNEGTNKRQEKVNPVTGEVKAA